MCSSEETPANHLICAKYRIEFILKFPNCTGTKAEIKHK
ncbi:hypothetical protein B4168_3906 [Anoxybacillus flavithermus]|nr:hypothetical protein B4168_3906 [Anoxybacillus flavithermus]OAO87909.1 hypothetical protein GT23_0642 [Parageobacillus thermoglucosidasius]